ncbi:MAG: hypothetical protein AB7K86_22570 [Rhodospirillales bacterium]
MLVAAAALSGCAMLGEQPPVESPAGPEAVAQEPEPEPSVADKTPPLPKPRPRIAARPRVDAPAQPQPPASQPAPSADPNQVVGMTEAEATGLIGPPHRSDVEPPARVWVYDGERCTLRVFFYLDLGREAFRALTWSIAHPEGEGPDDWRCFGKFVNDARSRA